MVASPDKAAAVNPVPSPISICVLVRATSDNTPELLAFLAKILFAATFCMCAKSIEASV